MKEIATDIYTFSELLKRDCVYVDKTGMILPFIEERGGKQYFLARPRRFGKSLMVSTLQAIFEGRRELFKGLAIEKSGWEWEKFPVIRLDMSTTAADTVEGFHFKINNQLQKNRVRLGVDVQIELDGTPDVNLESLITAAAASTPAGKVVLLIDEYDKPLLNHLCTEKVEIFREKLKEFYSVIKSTEEVQRFTFITGVSKFSKMSIFSGLNNLTDLTMSAGTATMFGYTHEEVKTHFGEHLKALAVATGMTEAGAFERVLKMYDGYRFHHKGEKVVNPVSLGKCLSEKEFGSHWFETGTPTFLVEMLKRNPMDITKLELGGDQLGAYDPANPEIEPLLFQTGYLTIAEAETMGGLTLYRLDFPNVEVRDAFNTSLIPAYTGQAMRELRSAQVKCLVALRNNDLTGMFNAIEVFLAGIPYDLTGGGGEKVWQTIMFTMLRFIGVGVETEVETSTGRIDAVIETGTHFYVIEIKLDKPVEDALEQIREKEYAKPYMGRGKEIVLVGVSFSSEKRGIDGWKYEEVKSARSAGDESAEPR